MSNRRAGANRIRGPQSALTDFLAANNISAQEIRDSYQQRSRQAETQNATEQARSRALRTSQRRSTTTLNTTDLDTDAGSSNKDGNDEEEPAQDDDDDDDLSSEVEQTKKSTKSKAKQKAKQSKKSMKRKAGNDDDDDNWGSSKPVPGQLESCEICDKRFTVTAYSKTGPDGGLVCTPCGRNLVQDESKAERKPKRAAPGKTRRKLESNRLDGIVSLGAKSLQQLCIEKVADHHLDIEEFGDLPDSLIDKLCQIFSKRRVMNSRTAPFFLRPDLDTVAIHDAANLESDDFKQIFAVVPNITKLVLRNASQFKDSVLQYMMDKARDITHFHVYASNLVSASMWKIFFQRHGHKLESLKLAWLDAYFDDDVVATMVQYAPNLRRLKLKYCRKISSISLNWLCHLKQLQHLSLQLSQPVEPQDLVALVDAHGPRLETLSLEGCNEADDSVIQAIQTHCSKLVKFRLSDVDRVTDAALHSLFDSSSNVKSLGFVDVSSSRDVDYNNPDGLEEHPIGMTSNAFKALMANQGYSLRTLNIASCRHISHDAFWEVFVESKSANEKPFPLKYTLLEELNISFCNSIDTPIIRGIFQSCPNLKKLVAFGCFKIEDVTVPQGVVLIGVPRAQDGIEQHGDAVTDTQSHSFFDMMASLSNPSAGHMISVDA